MKHLLLVPALLCALVFCAAWALIWLVVIALLLVLIDAILGPILTLFLVLATAGFIDMIASAPTPDAHRIVD